MEILLHIEFICEFNFRRNKNDPHKLKKHETGERVGNETEWIEPDMMTEKVVKLIKALVKWNEWMALIQFTLGKNSILST